MNILSKYKALAVWGYGVEGRSVVKHIEKVCDADVEVTILTDKPVKEECQHERNVTYVSGEKAAALLKQGAFELVIKSPGISLYKPVIEKAKEAGTLFTSSTNIWFESNPDAVTIVVTGTKGKTTTSELLTAGLRKLGKDVRLLGNGGVPLIGQTPGTDYTIIELSSYQIADLQHSPDYVLLTNLFPEHIPWHGSLEQYYRDKTHLCLNESVKVIANCRNEALQNVLSDRNDVIWYDTNHGFEVSEGQLLYRGEVIEVDALCPKGAHNLSNLAGVATLLNTLLPGSVRDKIELADFHMPPHRLEETTYGNQVLVVDDSISTIPESTVAALNVYANRRVHLILGGEIRGVDFSGLIEVLVTSNLGVVCVLPDLEEAFSGLHSYDIKVRSCSDMSDAVGFIKSNLSIGDVILLSPAAPSFSQYRSFIDRGKDFQKVCRDQLTNYKVEE